MGSSPVIPKIKMNILFKSINQELKNLNFNKLNLIIFNKTYKKTSANGSADFIIAESKHIIDKKFSGIYWNPIQGSTPFTLNDYQYIKCKWIFELLTGGYTVIHQDYGFIINPSFLNSLIKKNKLNNFKSTYNKNSSNWINELLGDYSKIYASVLKSKELRLKSNKRN
jgi:hypothetical protein